MEFSVSGPVTLCHHYAALQLSKSYFALDLKIIRYVFVEGIKPDDLPIIAQ